MVYLYLEKLTKQNTLQKNINESFVEYMTQSSGDASSRLTIYSTINPNSSTYIRNTGNWVQRIGLQGSGLDLTGISLNLDQIDYNTTTSTTEGLDSNDGQVLVFPSGYTYGVEAQCCTLIAPQYAISVNHYALPINGKVAFITNDNQIIERTISTGLMMYSSGIMNYNRDYIYSPAQPYPNCEFNILKLDTPILQSDNIKYYKLMPKFYYKIYKRLTKGQYIYTCGVNGSQEILVKKFFGGVGFFNGLDEYNMFSKNVVVGDSSHPIFTIINNDLTYISSWTSKDSYSNGIATPVFDGSIISGVQQAINIMGGEYQIELQNINNFNKFYPE